MRCCRGGLDEKTAQLLEHFANVLYISCNPQTLRANIAGLLDKHRIQRFAIFDQVCSKAELRFKVRLIQIPQLRRRGARGGFGLKCGHAMVSGNRRQERLNRCC